MVHSSRTLTTVIFTLVLMPAAFPLGTEFDDLDGWREVLGEVKVVEGAAVLTTDPTKAYGEIRSYMTLDIEQYPIIEMSCLDGEYKVYLADTHAKEGEIKYLRIGHKVSKGAARFYLKDLTPWRGRRNVVLVIQTQSSVSIDYIRFIAQGEAEAAIHEARPIPRYIVKKTTGKIDIDGELKELAWKRCDATPPIRLTDGHLAALSTTTAKMMWDKEHLYLAVQCVDRDVYGSKEKRDDNLWEEDVVGIYITIPNAPEHYVEFEVNANSAMTDLLNLKPSQGLVNWDCRGWEARVFVDGTTDNRSDEDVGWTIEMKIPLFAIYAQPLLPERAKEKEDKWQSRSGKRLKDPLLAFDFRPRTGEIWRANFVRIDHEKKHVEYQAWSAPIVQGFHVPERFGEILFSEEKVGKK